MSSPTVVLRDIDFDKFLDSGILVDAAKDTKYRQKCYVIANLDPNNKKIDVAVLVKEAIGTFNKDHYVILHLTTGTTTKIRNIKNGGGITYLKVENNFSLPSHLKIQDQDRICLVGSAGKDNLHGGASDDKLIGGAGDDKLYGGANSKWPADVLYGNAVNDRLYGGVGDNMYYFNNFLYHTGHDVIQLDSKSKGIDMIGFGFKQYFMTKWDYQKQEAQFYLLTSNRHQPSLAYSGKDHITVKGFSKTRKLFIKNGLESSSVALTVHKITYKVKGQDETRDFQTFLPKGTKEVFLPSKCDLVGLYGPDNRLVNGAFQKTFIDETKTRKLNALFGVK